MSDSFLEFDRVSSAVEEWPDWLEEYRIDDIHLAEAYEHVGMRERVGIKQCMAFCQYLYSPFSESESEIKNSQTAGFAYSKYAQAAPWALFVVTPHYNAPSHIASLIMAAVLSHVRTIALVSIDTLPQESILAVSELAGIEDNFVLSTDAIEKLLAEMSIATASRGRLVLFHRGELACLSDTAKKTDTPVFEENTAPRIGYTEESALDKDLLFFAHGMCEKDNALRNPGATKVIDAVYTDNSSCLTVLPKTVFHPDTAACWLYPALPQDFFRNSNLCVDICLPQKLFFE